MAAASTDDILRRVPPQNLEAEQSVLGAILLENEAINQALEVLNPDDFYRESHREIFRVMTELSDRNQPVDAITMTDALRTRGLKILSPNGDVHLPQVRATDNPAAIGPVVIWTNGTAGGPECGYTLEPPRKSHPVPEAS